MNQQRQSIPIIIASAILLFVTSLACDTKAKPDHNPLITPSATVSGEGTLIFQSKRDGNAEIYRVQADGTGLVNLTNDPGDDTLAVWSPDGKQIAFNSDRGGQWGLYVMNSDGSNPRRVYGLEDPARPAWSPDGKWIAMSPGVIINVDGRVEPVTTGTDGGELCLNPTWSPDGAQIACEGVSVRNVDLAGRNVKRAGHTQMARRYNQFPVWSPDGTRIAFLADDGFVNENSGHTDICTINPDLSGLAYLSSNQKGGSAPAWSPDGTKIAYIARQCTGLFECGTAEIQVVNADGTVKIQLTYNEFKETELAWSPDGTRIAFAAGDLFIINADGSAQMKLVTPGSGGVSGLSWQPIAP